MEQVKTLNCHWAQTTMVNIRTFVLMTKILQQFQIWGQLCNFRNFRAAVLRSFTHLMCSLHVRSFVWSRLTEDNNPLYHCRQGATNRQYECNHRLNYINHQIIRVTSQLPHIYGSKRNINSSKQARSGPWGMRNMQLGERSGWFDLLRDRLTPALSLHPGSWTCSYVSLQPATHQACKGKGQDTITSLLCL